MSAEQAPSARRVLDLEYEILRELGRGGTAIVYLARKRSTGAEVAIKLIRSTYLEDEEALARFAREARVAARLNHPNVVPILEVLALEGGGIALIMAHVTGRTLKQLIRDEGRLAPEHAERLMRDVASGLNAAHAMGIIHRDVKPENIFIDQSGRALLADFGLARSMTADTQLTMTGVVIGTPTYMPPEQIDGSAIDARGDVYSLGLVAWEMLTGRRPWDGASLYALLYHQKHDFLPDVREIRSDVSDRLANVIATAIEKEPAARWQGVPEMIAALNGAVGSHSGAARTPVSSDTVRFERFTPIDATRIQAAPRLSPRESHTIAATPASPALTWIGSRAGHKAAARRRKYTIAAGVLASLIVGAFAIYGVRRVRETSASARYDSPVAASRGSDGSRATLTAPAARPESSVSIPPVDSARPIARGADSAATRQISVRDSDARRSVQVSPVTMAGIPRAAEARPEKAVVPAPPVRSAAAARVSIVTGGMHTCLIADGRGYCWGENVSGQLGTGGTTRAATPSAIGADLPLVALAAGLSHSCAIARGGGVWCWGANDHGQLGDHSTTPHSAPVRVADGHAFRAITAGASHSCALDTDGVAWCWGAGTHGQLGNGGAKDSDVPVALSKTPFTAIAAGWNFTCALDDAGKAYCWGESRAGQLGIGETVDHNQPTAVSTDVAFVAIAAGNAHACGVTAQGDAYCWGQNSSGQLGDGTTSDHLVPTRVKSSLHFTSITAGARHTCAVNSEGEAYCWGLDSYGQLGNDGGANQLQPTRVAGGHSFSSVRAFGSHTCGTTVSGEAFCWGYNLDGQLGDGTRINRSRPVYLEPPTSK